MESVINFLADNYIWFFVAAGVLTFALIGFLIDSKKKKNSEFKGESFENNVPVDYSVNDVENSNNSVNEVNSIGEISEMPTNEETVNSEVESLNNEAKPLDNEVEPLNNVDSPSSEPSNIDFTMQINDIPLAEPEEVYIEPTPVNTNLESVNESTEQIVNEPVQMEPIQIEPVYEENVQNTFETNNVIMETPTTNNMEVPETVTPISEVNETTNEEVQQEVNDFEIFDDIK